MIAELKCIVNACIEYVRESAFGRCVTWEELDS